MAPIDLDCPNRRALATEPNVNPCNCCGQQLQAGRNKATRHFSLIWLCMFERKSMSHRPDSRSRMGCSIQTCLREGLNPQTSCPFWADGSACLYHGLVAWRCTMPWCPNNGLDGEGSCPLATADWVQCQCYGATASSYFPYLVQCPEGEKGCDRKRWIHTTKTMLLSACQKNPPYTEHRECSHEDVTCAYNACRGSVLFHEYVVCLCCTSVTVREGNAGPLRFRAAVSFLLPLTSLWGTLGKQ